MSSLTVGAHSRPSPGRWQHARRVFTDLGASVGRVANAAADRAMSLRQIALTVTGLGFVDAAAYQVSNGVGLLATGASVLVLEWLTSD